MKRYLSVLLLICLLFTGCTSQRQMLSEIAEFTLPADTTITYIDTHGGFHGDGAIYAKAVFQDAFRNKVETVFTESAGWHTFPLSENVSAVIYGSETHTAISESNEKIPPAPAITSGFWRLIDRHSESTDPGDDAQLLDRASYNFTVMLYDCTNNVLYFYILDT